jgi:YHS domain-containing protein
MEARAALVDVQKGVLMRRLLFLTLLLSSAFGAAVLSAKDQEPAKKPASQPATQPVNKFCPIEPDNEVDPKIKTVVYKGKTIGFCCADCINAFNKSPDKYAEKLK